MQTTTELFDKLADADVRPVTVSLRMSLDKTKDDSVQIFTLDSSILDGPDVLAPNDQTPIMPWDYYKYANYDDRLMMAEWSQEIEFPYSVSTAVADFTLANYDDYFKPGSTSPVASYILPRRPVRILSGFAGFNIPQFVGITEKMPVINDRDKTAQFHAIGALAQIFNMKITSTLAMSNVRTDEVLAVIFEQFGLVPEQYSLDKGRNIIPFLFYETGTLAGDVLRKLMQAEMGNLWLDENGVIRFSQRLLKVQTPVATFTDANVVDIKTSGDDKIINTVKINSDIRVLQEFQIVASKSKTDSTLFVIGAGQSRTYQIQLSDPCKTIQDPTLGIGSGASWFTAALPDGTDVASGVSVTSTELKTNTFDVTFYNSNSFSVDINAYEMWGEPGKVVDQIEYTEINQDSIDKYEEQVLTIDNIFIQSIEQCESLAITILDQFAEYATQIDLEVKGNPAVQLNDIVYVNSRGYEGNFRLIKKGNKVDGKYTQTLTAVKYTPRSWFTLDQSLLDGTDVLTP